VEGFADEPSVVVVGASVLYVALASGLSKKPDLFAMAWIVVVALTGMAEVYTVEEAVGALPLVV